MKVLDIECLWSVLSYYEGQEFYTVTGKGFMYKITIDFMQVKNIRITKESVSKVLCQLPAQKAL